MRKIMSPEAIEKKEKKNRLVVGGVMIFLLFASTLGYALIGGGFTGSGGNSDGDNSGNYNGNYWVYEIGGQTYYLSYSLEDVQSVDVQISKNLGNYLGKPLFLSGDSTYLMQEVASNLGKHVERIQEACYGPCDEDLPEKDCTENLIVFVDSNENKVYEEDNCVFVEGDLSATDAFLYKVLGLD